jgi:hypothetical protein
VDTGETDRATGELKRLTEEINKTLPNTKADKWLVENGYDFMTWDIVEGWKNEKENIKNTTAPGSALEHILKDDTKAGIYVMHNFHLLWDTNKPRFIELFHKLANHNKYNYKHLFLVGNTSNIPIEIKDIVVNISFDMPSKEEIRDYIEKYCNNLGTKETKKNIEAVADAATGMTINEVENALYVSVVTNQGKKINRDLIFEEKARKVRQSGLLEYIKSDETIENVGGLSALKEQIADTAHIFNNFDKAKAYGLKMPKGVLLVGIPGGGKTLSAKAIANLFGVPLFRSDLGRVFGGIVGESENNVRELTKLMSSLSPCVILWDLNRVPA